jgi:hypothetical protein
MEASLFASFSTNSNISTSSTIAGAGGSSATVPGKFNSSVFPIVESYANRTSSLYLRLEISKGDLILPSGWLSVQLLKS